MLIHKLNFKIASNHRTFGTAMKKDLLRKMDKKQRNMELKRKTKERTTIPEEILTDKEINAYILG